MPRVLFISNGAGEDSIACEVISRLKGDIEVSALPLVGCGSSYRGIASVEGPVKNMPSGGLIPEGLSGLASDIKGGLVKLTFQQLAWMRGQRKNFAASVAVGDLFAAIMAGLSGIRPLLFIGTAKSDYHHAYSGLEAFVMRLFSMRVVARDEPTAAHLRSQGVQAVWVGNAMMDSLVPAGTDLGLGGKKCLAMFPGSREGTYSALPKMLSAYEILAGKMEAPEAFVVMAPSIDLERLGNSCPGYELRLTGHESGVVGKLTGEKVSVRLTKGIMADVLSQSILSFGVAGTAHEQSAGMGVPVVSFGPAPGKKLGWYRGRQKGLLGDALEVAGFTPESAAMAMKRLLEDDADRARRGKIGMERMGPRGGAQGMAEIIWRMAHGEYMNSASMQALSCLPETYHA